MVGDVRTGSAWEPSFNGDLCLGQCDVCTSHRSQDAWRVPAGNPRQSLTVTLRWSAISRLLLDLRICHGIALATDALGEYRFVLLCMLLLFSAVQGALSLEALPVSFPSARHLWNSTGRAVDSHQPGLSDPSCNRNHDVLDPSIEQQKLMGLELVLGLARLVYRSNKRNEKADTSERSRWS